LREQAARVPPPPVPPLVSFPPAVCVLGACDCLGAGSAHRASPCSACLGFPLFSPGRYVVLPPRRLAPSASPPLFLAASFLRGPSPVPLLHFRSLAWVFGSIVFGDLCLLAFLLSPISSFSIPSSRLLFDFGLVSSHGLAEFAHLPRVASRHEADWHYVLA